ncbi:MAG: RNase adapter RapZ, partial [Actinomycetota bacterium]
GGDIDRLALVAGRQHTALVGTIAELRATDHQVTVLFLDATTPTLVARYDATRRRHPYEDAAEGVEQAIEAERAASERLRAEADLVIDTTDLNVHDLADRIASSIGRSSTADLRVSIASFGFKHGSPRDADIVMDVRFLPNPHWEPELRPLTGLDDAVRSFVLDGDEGESFVERFGSLLADLVPAYASGGRSYLTVGIGCTGGRHRSVAIVEELARRLAETGVSVRTRHRDIGR